MVEFEKFVTSGQDLSRAFDLLARANQASIPTLPQVLTKQGLLAEARRAVDAAKDALAH